MKKLLFLLLSVGIAFSACKKEKNESQDKDENAGASISNDHANNEKASTNVAGTQSELMGTYTGMFLPIDGQGQTNKITISINEMQSNGDALGHSIVAGNNRPFKGTYKKDGENYVFSVSEPGDDKYDGKFEFSIIPATKKMTGRWNPNDKKLKSKTYNLDRRDFKYDPKAGDSPYLSERVLSEEEVANSVKSELRLMRNEIYARHGYAFKMKDMRAQFENKDWYMPTNTDVRGMLTEIEKKNVDLIKRYEKYAAEYYDSFGR